MLPGRGVVVLAGGEQVAVFRLPERVVAATLSANGELAAIGNSDPFSGANVLARGIVGESDGTAYVASPMYKQRFDLRTGACLEDENISVPVFAVREREGRIEVAHRPGDCGKQNSWPRDAPETVP